MLIVNTEYISNLAYSGIEYNQKEKTLYQLMNQKDYMYLIQINTTSFNYRK